MRLILLEALLVAAFTAVVGSGVAWSQPAKPQSYQVTLYSGGQAVRRWIVPWHPAVNNKIEVEMHGVTIVGGTVVIEPCERPENVLRR